MTQTPMAWVLHYDGHQNGHGRDLLSAHTSSELARAALARIARGWWPDLHHQAASLPQTPGGLSDDDVIRLYFAATTDEHWTIASIVISGSPQPNAVQAEQPTAPAGSAPWVPAYEHRHGTDASLWTTQEGVRAALADTIRRYWDEVSDRHGVPATPDGLTDHEAIGLYFRNHDQESYQITRAVVTQHPGTGAGLTGRAPAQQGRARADITSPPGNQRDAPETVTETYPVVDALPLRLSFTPAAIRQHFDDDEDYDLDGATDEQLARAGATALNDDGIYQAFHQALAAALGPQLQQ